MKPNYRNISFWHDSLPTPASPRAKLEADLQAEVVIVGGGYTGLWTAYYLKQFNPELDIVLLESELAGFGASGRNGGWCISHLAGIDRWLHDPAYRESALHLKQLMFKTVREIGDVCETEGIDCHYDYSGALMLAVLPIQVKRLQAYWRGLQQLGLTDEHYCWLNAKEIADIYRVDRALAGILIKDCAAIHPARLARGLAECIEAQGVRIYEQSPVLSMKNRVVTTVHGKVSADNVIITTEGYSGNLEGPGQRLIPVHSMMVASEVLDQEQLDVIGFQRRCTFTNLDRVVTYGQVTADRRIAFGCRGTYLFGSAIRGQFAMDEPEFRRVQHTLLRFFPALEGIRFTHAWGGAMGVSRAVLPSVNFDKEKRCGWAGGYFGSGVAATHLAAQTLADLVCGRESERLDTPWVNPDYAKRRWEPEPLRWLGVRGARSLMGVADDLEYRGGDSGILSQVYWTMSYRAFSYAGRLQHNLTCRLL